MSNLNHHSLSLVVFVCNYENHLMTVKLNYVWAEKQWYYDFIWTEIVMKNCSTDSFSQLVKTTSGFKNRKKVIAVNFGKNSLKAQCILVTYWKKRIIAWCTCKMQRTVLKIIDNSCFDVNFCWNVWQRVPMLFTLRVLDCRCYHLLQKWWWTGPISTILLEEECASTSLCVRDAVDFTIGRKVQC